MKFENSYQVCSIKTFRIVISKKNKQIWKQIA